MSAYAVWLPVEVRLLHAIQFRRNSLVPNRPNERRETLVSNNARCLQNREPCCGLERDSLSFCYGDANTEPPAGYCDYREPLCFLAIQLCTKELEMKLLKSGKAEEGESSLDVSSDVWPR